MKEEAIRESTYAAALEYAGRGWCVFPCRPRDKRPATEHGCKDATTSRHQIARWWLEHRDRGHVPNVAIATGPQSGVWVLDVDGEEGVASLRALEAQYGKLPATLTQKTGGGGLQMIWRWPTGLDVRNTAHRIAPHIDTRGAGGYIVAPPSIHPSGRRYRWLNDAPVANAPAWLLNLVCAKPRREEALTVLSILKRSRGIDGALRWFMQQPVGKRNDSLYWLAHVTRESGYPLADAERALVLAATERGLSEKEALATIRSAYACKRG